MIANKIFVLGGYDGQKALTTNTAYYPSRDLAGEDPWETLAPLPEGRYAMGVTHLANVIYLAGGITDQGTLARITIQYIPPSNEWAEYDAPPIPAGAHGVLLSSGGFLHYLGGESTQGLLATHEAYQAIYTYSIPILRDDK